MSAYPTSPTAFQFALALTVVRSKPAELSTRDYIQQLRKHTYKGTRPIFSATYEESQRNYVNAALFFESLYKETLAKENELNTKIAILEREVRILNKELDGVSSSPSLGKVHKRRSNEGEDERAQKRLRSETNLDSLSLEEHISRNLEDWRPTAEEHILRDIFNLQKILQRSEPSSRSLAFQIQRLLSSVSVRIEDIHNGEKEAESEATRTRSGSTTNADTKALKRAFQILMRAFDVLNDANLDDYDPQRLSDQGATTYKILSFMRALLNLHAKEAESQAEASENEAVSNTSGTTSTLETINLLLISFLQFPARATPSVGKARKELLEGTLHLLLTRAGKLLYTLTFSDPRPGNLQAEISRSFDLDAATEDVETMASGCSIAVRAARIESRNIFPLLRRLLKPRSLDGVSLSDIDTSVPLVDKPLRRLQNTLMRGVFGDEGAVALGEGLALPVEGSLESTIGDDAVQCEQGDEDGDEDWFLRRMWDVCGWEVLGETSLSP